MADSRAGRGNHEMTLKHLVLPESKDVLIKLKGRALGKAQSQPERTSSGPTWNNRSSKNNNSMEL